MTFERRSQTAEGVWTFWSSQPGGLPNGSRRSPSVFSGRRPPGNGVGKAQHPRRGARLIAVRRARDWRCPCAARWHTRVPLITRCKHDGGGKAVYRRAGGASSQTPLRSGTPGASGKAPGPIRSQVLAVRTAGQMTRSAGPCRRHVVGSGTPLRGAGPSDAFPVVVPPLP